MMIPILSLLVMAMISLIVARLAAVALTLTGLSSEVARFQARSALAGVGFTTRESEAIVNHPVRRRIILWLMFVGNIGIPAVVATLVVSFFSTAQTEHPTAPLLILFLGMTTLGLLARSRTVERHMNRAMVWVLKRWTRLDLQDYVSVLQLDNGFAVTEMFVEADDWIEGRTLADAALTREGILVLGIRRENGEYVGAPRGTDLIRAGDTLVLYGRLDRLADLDTRRKP